MPACGHSCGVECSGVGDFASSLIRERHGSRSGARMGHLSDGGLVIRSIRLVDGGTSSFDPDRLAFSAHSRSAHTGSGDLQLFDRMNHPVSGSSFKVVAEQPCKSGRALHAQQLDFKCGGIGLDDGSGNV